MNKLGFYIEVSTVEFLRDALAEVKPPVILFHRGDRGLLQEIRRGLSPNSFIIGRWPLDISAQDAMLDSSDPAAAGRQLADQILGYDFGYATERVDGRLLIDAWMSLNEPLRGPASFPNEQVDALFRRRAEALDKFQEAFRQRLQTQNLEAVAFNFGAGNYTRPEHYSDWFPRTLQSHTYLGFHEYGWPTLMPQAGTETGALLYRPVMEKLRSSLNRPLKAVMTEAGLARMYKYRGASDDVGWLYPADSIPQDQYWESLHWYNTELCRDDYVVGACLYEVGHGGGRWITFRHLGKDNNQQPITILSRVARLRDEPPPLADDRAVLRQRVAAAEARLAGVDAQLRQAAAQVDQIRAPLASVQAAAAEATRMQSQAAALTVRIQQARSVLASQANAPLVAQADALLAQLNGLQGQLQTVANLATAATSLQAALAPWAAETARVPAVQQELARVQAVSQALRRDLA